MPKFISQETVNNQPAAIPGGGSSLPPATATMMWSQGVKNAYEQALSAHNKLVSNGHLIQSLIAKMSAATAQAEQAKLAAESSAAASFARDNGFAVAAATASMGGTTGSSTSSGPLGVVAQVSRCLGEAIMVLAGTTSTASSTSREDGAEVDQGHQKCGSGTREQEEINGSDEEDDMEQQQLLHTRRRTKRSSFFPVLEEDVAVLHGRTSTQSTLGERRTIRLESWSERSSRNGYNDSETEVDAKNGDMSQGFL
ncbi:unnamed protein product [Amoebophrya sp. A120]|nr:unnamed protein product [Amoebophrya sp. A120]|eukprot:GSA120T00020685001.1